MKLSLRLIKYKPIFYKLFTFFLVTVFMAAFTKAAMILIASILKLTLLSIFSGIALLCLALMTSFFIFVTLVHCGKKLRAFQEIHVESEEV